MDAQGYIEPGDLQDTPRKPLDFSKGNLASMLLAFEKGFRMGEKGDCNLENAIGQFKRILQGE
jgi:hypothetical protein